LICKWYC